MTEEKARRRYPYGSGIKYIGDKKFIVYGGNYYFNSIHGAVSVVNKNALGYVAGYVYDRSNGAINYNNVIGIEVDFETTMDFNCSLPTELIFGEDLFVRDASDAVVSHSTEDLY